LFSLLATSVVIASDLPKFDPPPDEVVYRGVTEQQWETITSIGDPLNCRQQVYDLQNLDLTEFHELTPENCSNKDCIARALITYSKVILREGIYKIKELDLANKILIGHPNETVILNASKASIALKMRKSIIANLIIQNARDIGVLLRYDNLVYRTVVGNTGLYYPESRRGIGFNQEDRFLSKNNCIVSAEAYNGYNYKASDAAGKNGGSADGFDVKRSKESNFTFIDTHGHHNSDHGFDFYCSGNEERSPVARLYYSSAIKNKNPFKIGGDVSGIKLGGEALEGDKECRRNDEKNTPRILYSTVACYNPGYDLFNLNNIKLIKINSSNDPYKLKCSDFSYVKKIEKRSFDIGINKCEEKIEKQCLVEKCDTANVTKGKCFSYLDKLCMNSKEAEILQKCY
jgi:hypothetical protein